MVELIGAPFDLCGPVLGSRLGPMAMRLTDVVFRLRDLGVEIEDIGDAFGLSGGSPVSGVERAEAALRSYSILKTAVRESIGRGATPLVVSGDHSLALATISGALEVYGGDLAVLWVDAHMDLNTPSTSPSGNLHGMPVGALLKLPAGEQRFSEQEGAFRVWDRVLSDVVPGCGLSAGKVGWVGLRDVDSGEVRNYQSSGAGPAMTMQDVDRMGIKGVMESIFAWIEEIGVRKLWVSFDVDSLDPLLAPGTGTKVRGGLTYREGHFVAESIYQYLCGSESVSLAGIDVVEVNPMTDQAGQTAKVATEWLCSIFGMTIMGDKP